MNISENDIGELKKLIKTTVGNWDNMLNDLDFTDDGEKEALEIIRLLIMNLYILDKYEVENASKTHDT